MTARFLKGAVAALLLLCTAIQSTAQDGNITYIQKQFDKYSNKSLHEKVFVHTDRNLYTTGEIVWFKAYCTSENGQISTLSKVAYIEILDKDQQPVLQAKIGLDGGTGSGSLALPANLLSGNYVFRAYTNWMKNFDPDYYFHQQITILNTLQTGNATDEKTTGNFDIRFFPEGGDMVNDLGCKVAFRAIDEAGKGIDFKAVLLDQTNDTIIRFHPLAFGIGSFFFTPKKNVQYKALITTATSKVITQNLPAALNTGYSMTVAEMEKEGRLKLTVQTNTDSKFIYLFIHGGQQVKTAMLLNFINGKTEIEIDKTQLSEGFSNITLFDKNNEPVCERLYFKRPQRRLLIEAKSDAATYPPRKKVTIDLTAKNDSNTPQSSDMSLSVFLIDSLNRDYNDIYSYQWLSSELKGNIESPGYYFSKNTPQVNEALDNLMLTHGWRRFKWKDVLRDQQPVLTFLPEYEGHIVTGRVMNTATQLPAENIPVFLSLPGTHFQLYHAKSGKDGTVQFNTTGLQGTRLMVALANTVDSASYRVDLSSPFSEDISSFKSAPFSNFTMSSTSLLRRSINTQVQNVYSGKRLNVFETPKTDSLNFYGKADSKYMFDDYTRFPTMEEVLREYVMPVVVRKRKDHFFLTMVDKDELGNPTVQDPVILLDGVPQFDNGNKITNYNPLKVQRLETIKSVYYLGGAKFDGIASFFTYKGDLDGFQLDSASTVLDYEGLQLRREFYAPAYTTADAYSSRMPDFRTLLYWSPDIKTDDTGKKQIEFYTSDLTGKYAIVVQGISQDGKAGSTLSTIEVRK